MQLDLFNDFDEARVFRCVGGYFIGHFQKYNEADPVKRISDYYDNETDADAALQANTWNPTVSI